MNHSILLVDDDRDACTTAAELLRTRGYHVNIAFNGTAALAMCDAERYALAVIDYQMPGMNGVELFRRMRLSRPDILGIFLTGYTTLDVVYPAIEAGILRVLAKPVDFNELVEIMVEYLGEPNSMQMGHG